MLDKSSNTIIKTHGITVEGMIQFDLGGGMGEGSKRW